MTFQHKDKIINVLDKKRIHLLDKINAYFKQVKEHEINFIHSKKQLCDEFDKKVNEGLEIFK